jgi:hypothetical protein
MTLASQLPTRAEFHAHHAHLIEAAPDTGRVALEQYCEHELAFSVHGNPDYVPFVFDTLYIETARQLQTQAAQRPLVHPFSLYVVAFRTMTVEAQNALLKLIEDPGPHVRLVLIVPSADTLLPTVRSRLSYWGEIVEAADHERQEHVCQFLNAPIADRLEVVRPFIQQKDIDGALAFTAILESELYAQFRAGQTEYAEVLSQVTQCRQYLQDRAPSVKMILEYMAVTVPRPTTTEKERAA